MSGPVKGPGWPDTRPAKITATFDSLCPECHEDIYTGDEIWWSEWHDMYICRPCKKSGA